MENLESNLNGISFSTKVLGNDLKISIEYRDAKSKCSIKKIQKLCDSEFDTKLMENLNFVETNFMVKIRLFRALNSECIKFYNLPRK